MLDINLARNWPEEDKIEFYASRERLLIDAHRTGSIALSEIVDHDASNLYAVVSLVQDGMMVLDPQTPGVLNLSGPGQKLARGTVALRYGED